MSKKMWVTSREVLISVCDGLKAMVLDFYFCTQAEEFWE